MRARSSTPETPSERLVRGIRRATRKQYSAEEKIRIVLDGLRGEVTIAELCRREGIAEGLYYSWSKEFLEAGKRRLAGDTARAATSSEVKDLKRFPWGDDLPPNGVPRCNVWRGAFPNSPKAGWCPEPVAAADGEPNGFGLINVCGNVWEWCADWFSPTYHRETAVENPLFAQSTGRRSMRSGSFLCHDSYCNRYRVAARSSNTPDSASSNLGFRVAK